MRKCAMEVMYNDNKLYNGGIHHGEITTGSLFEMAIMSESPGGSWRISSLVGF